MPKNRGDKPKGRMSSYAYFVQCCREEHKKKHPGENVVFGEFTKKCAGKWKEMTPKEKKRFEDMADKDKIRYQKEMADYTPDNPKAGGRAGKKRTKDPNAPKRALSAFFLFCNEQRPDVRKDHGGWSVGEVAKELGKRWEKQLDKTKYEALADIERKKYEKNMAAYKAGLQQEATKTKASPAKKARVEKVEEDDDDDDEEEEEEEEEDDDDDE